MVCTFQLRWSARSSALLWCAGWVTTSSLRLMAAPTGIHRKDSEAVLSEILGTAGLVFPSFRACDKQNAGNWFSACAIGFSVWIAHLSLIPIDGTSY